MIGLIPILFLFVHFISYLGYQLKTSGNDSRRSSGDSNRSDTGFSVDSCAADVPSFVDQRTIEILIDQCVGTIQEHHPEANEDRLREYARTRLHSLLPPRSRGDETPDELLSRTTARLMSELYEEILRNVREQAVRDSLTGVFDRGYFENKLETELERADRYGYSVSLLLFDLDQFKKINDAHGHCAGDIVLEQFADVLRNNTRSSDVICRYGGDEFAIILPRTGAENAREKAHALLNHVRSHTFTFTEDEGNQIQLKVSTSVGCASTCGGSGENTVSSPGELIRRADVALYRAKERGRNRLAG